MGDSAAKSLKRKRQSDARLMQQVLEDAEHLITTWNERQPKRWKAPRISSLA
jgi:hypothetical protein